MYLHSFLDVYLYFFMFARVDSSCRIFVKDGKEVSKMLQTCYRVAANEAFVNS